MTVEKTISLFFILDESYALFQGACDGYRFGGAGLQTFLLANELSKDDAFDVNWLFLDQTLEVDSLAHDRIKILKAVPPIKRGLPLLARRINRQRSIRPFISPHEKIVISSIGQNAPSLERFAHLAQARSVLRLSSDTDTTEPRGYDVDVATVFASYRAIDRVVVQSSAQEESLARNAGVSATCIPSLWPTRPVGPPDKVGVLWVASAQYLKQPWFLVELAKQFPDVPFTMVMPDVYPELSHFIRRQCLSLPNMTLIDRQLSLEQINSLFDHAAVYINTSETEGFPNTFLQAAASATPILSLTIDPDDVLGRNRIGMSAHGSFASLCDNLREMIEDDAIREEYGMNARHYVETVHNPDTIAHQWKTMLHDVISHTEER